MGDSVPAAERVFRALVSCLMLVGLLVLAIGLDPVGFFAGW